MGVMRERKLEHALRIARDKLRIYREQSDGKYQGGMEYKMLMNLIEEALNNGS